MNSRFILSKVINYSNSPSLFDVQLCPITHQLDIPYGRWGATLHIKTWNGLFWDIHGWRHWRFSMQFCRIFTYYNAIVKILNNLCWKSFGNCRTEDVSRLSTNQITFRLWPSKLDSSRTSLKISIYVCHFYVGQNQLVIQLIEFDARSSSANHSTNDQMKLIIINNNNNLIFIITKY